MSPRLRTFPYLSIAALSVLSFGMCRVVLEGIETGPWYAVAFLAALGAFLLFALGRTLLEWHRQHPAMTGAIPPEGDVMNYGTNLVLVYRVALLVILAATAATGLWMYRFDVVVTAQNRDGALVLDRWARTIAYCEHSNTEGRYATRCRDFYPATWDAVQQAATRRTMSPEELALWNAAVGEADAQLKAEQEETASQIKNLLKTYGIPAVK